MSIREINFPSANGRDTIKAWAYTPLGKPRAVIQLIHGFGEHSRRYLHMISKFQAAGFVVYADDHIGHGKTGFDGGTLGDPHSGGYMTYLRDEKYLHDIAHMAYPDLPFFVFGHSWGSMLGRAYAALVAVSLGGVNQAVAGPQGLPRAALGRVVVDLEHAVAEHGHAQTVLEFRVLHG